MNDNLVNVIVCIIVPKPIVLQLGKLTACEMELLQNNNNIVVATFYF